MSSEIRNILSSKNEKSGLLAKVKVRFGRFALDELMVVKLMMMMHSMIAQTKTT